MVEKNNLLMYSAIGLGLFFLLTAIESVEPGLSKVAKFLVLGYWCTLGLYVLLSIGLNIFSTFSFSEMLYNLWLFCSLMCVAIGILALIDDWPHTTGWAIWIVIYGATVIFIKRKEL